MRKGSARRLYPYGIGDDPFGERSDGAQKLPAKVGLAAFDFPTGTLILICVCCTAVPLTVVTLLLAPAPEALALHDRMAKELWQRALKGPAAVAFMK